MWDNQSEKHQILKNKIFELKIQTSIFFTGSKIHSTDVANPLCLARSKDKEFARKGKNLRTAKILTLKR